MSKFFSWRIGFLGWGGYSRGPLAVLGDGMFRHEEVDAEALGALVWLRALGLL